MTKLKILIVTKLYQIYDKTVKLKLWQNSINLNCDTTKKLKLWKLSKNNCCNYKIIWYFFLSFIGKSTNRKTYQYGTFSWGKSTILHLVLFLTGTFSYTPISHFTPSAILITYRLVESRYSPTLDGFRYPLANCCATSLCLCLFVADHSLANF